MNVTTLLNNGDSLRTLNIYASHNAGIRDTTMNIASGLKIRSAADNPANWAISEKMREQYRSVEQADVNVQNDTSLVKVAEAAIATTIEIIQTLKARAVNAADDHNNDDDRSIIQTEATKLLDQVDNISKTASFNGKNLLDGSQASEGLNFHIGGEANFYIKLKLNNMSASALGLDELDLSTSTGAQAALGVYDSSSGKYVHSITNNDGTKTYGILDTALNKALEEQTKLGAMEERLGFTRDNLNNISENTQEAISTLVDSDVAKEMSRYVKYNILSQASQYMLAQMNQNAASSLDLLAPTGQSKKA